MRRTRGGLIGAVLLGCGALGGLLGGCTVGGDTGSLPGTTESGEVDGVVFKGPMAAESTVTLQPLGEGGQDDGDPIVATIADASGAYSVDGVPRELVRVTAEGQALDEASGAVDAAPITLVAYAEVGAPEQSVHVNLLTDLTHLRVTTLLGTGLRPPDAIRQAQDELRAALPIGVGTEPANQGEDVDPYSDGFDASWLFAFSGVVAQAGHDQESAGVGSLPVLLDQIRTDLADDGRLADETRGAIYLAEGTFNPDLATTSLQTHATDNALGVTLPNPHPALDTDHDGVANDIDNCRYVANADQAAGSGLSFGQVCDDRIARITTTESWGCGVLGATGTLTCWQVDAAPLGGSPPRPDRFPEPPVAPWGAPDGAFTGAGYRDVALADGIACASDALGVSCWQEGTGVTTLLGGDTFSVRASAGLVCAQDATGAVACSRRADGTVFDLAAARTFALLGDAAVCTLDATYGALACFDDTGAPLVLPDLPTGAFTQLSAYPSGAGWGCVLDATGALSCFGGNALVSTAPPGGGYTQVAVGGSVACATDTGGAAVCWRDAATCPDLGDAPMAVTDLTAGECQVCGIDPEGFGVCWPMAWDVSHPPPE